jgi:hypothetical protein
VGVSIRFQNREHIETQRDLDLDVAAVCVLDLLRDHHSAKLSHFCHSE